MLTHFNLLAKCSAEIQADNAICFLVDKTFFAPVAPCERSILTFARNISGFLKYTRTVAQLSWHTHARTRAHSPFLVLRHLAVDDDPYGRRHADQTDHTVLVLPQRTQTGRHDAAAAAAAGGMMVGGVRECLSQLDYPRSLHTNTHTQATQPPQMV